MECSYIMKHTFEEKLNIVSILQQGYPLERICRERGLDHHEVYQWRLRYEAEGEEGLRKPTRAYGIPSEQKESIVREFIEDFVPLSQLSLRYNVHRTTLKVWIRKVREQGYDALYEQKRNGRPLKSVMPRPKKKEPQTEIEKLQAENLRLRAENALLKKVKALVEEQKARARLNGQKPSTN